MWEHDEDLDAEHTLAHEHMADSLLHVDGGHVTSLDHVTLLELHTLRTLGTEFARHDDLTTLGTCLHDEADHRVRGTADSQALDELVLEGFGLGIGAQSAFVDGLCEQSELLLLETESLLDDRGELLDALVVLAKDFLGVGGADDDLRADWGHADLDAGVALLAEFFREELVELGVEDAIGNELALFATTSS